MGSGSCVGFIASIKSLEIFDTSKHVPANQVAARTQVLANEIVVETGVRPSYPSMIRYEQEN